MSKAKRFAEEHAASHRLRPQPFMLSRPDDSPGEIGNRPYEFAHVKENGCLGFEQPGDFWNGYLEPHEALNLARWILDTFQEPMQGSIPEEAFITCRRCGGHFTETQNYLNHLELIHGARP